MDEAETANQPLTDDLGFLLSRASAVLARAASTALAPLELRVRSYSVLALAADHDGGITQRSIAALVGLDPSQVVSLVDGLQERGLVDRTPHPGDRRNKLVTVTERGRELRSRAQDSVAEQDGRCVAHLPEQQLDQLRAALRSIAFPGDGGR